MVGLVVSSRGLAWGAKTGAAGSRQAAPKKVAWDLDNTLFDTRYRTQAAVFAYAKWKRDPLVKHAAHLAKDIGNIGFDGASTAEKLGLSGAHAVAFEKHWNRFFWTAKSFRFDRVIPSSVAVLVREAADAETYYVTGRTRRSKTATLMQLRAAGLPNADAAHLIQKQNVGVKTLPFKLATLEKLGVAFYGTDSPREVDALSAQGTKSIWIDFPVKHPSAEAPASAVLGRVRIEKAPPKTEPITR